MSNLSPLALRLSQAARGGWEVVARVVEEMVAEKDGASDPIVEAVRADLLRRSTVGIAKYGVTLADAGLGLRDWLEHAYSECLDMANYLKAAIVALDAGKEPGA